MNSKFSVAAGVFAAIAGFFVTSNEMAVAGTASCNAAFAFDTNNSFGDCVGSLSMGGSPPSVEVYARRQEVQIAAAVDQYNTTFTANIAQWVGDTREIALRVLPEAIADRDTQNSIRVASAKSSIQCRSFAGKASYLCQAGKLPQSQHRLSFLPN
jgi:hypothetical protein